MKRFLILVLALSLAAPIWAQEMGKITGLPIPRFVSLKSNSTNARRGPSLSHRVDWEFLRKGLPVRVTAEYENWRRVEDSEGAGGWVHYTLLSGSRTVLVTADEATLYRNANAASAKVAVAEAGVIGFVDSCSIGWCEIEIGSYDGWTEAGNLWGVYSTELAAQN